MKKGKADKFKKHKRININLDDEEDYLDDDREEMYKTWKKIKRKKPTHKEWEY